MVYDIVIVGAGPAGLTAAIYACRADKRVLVLEKATFGGQITSSPCVENYPGFVKMSGNEFADKLLEQALGLGAEIEMAEATAIKEQDGLRVVKTDRGDFTARAVILATGARHRPLGIANEEKFVGRGISYCAVCDGAFYRDKDVLMIGGGNSALQETVLLSDMCKSVTVVQNLSFLTGEPRLIRKLEEKENVKIILSHVVDALEGDTDLRRVVIRHAETGEKKILTTDGMFVCIGQMPENAAFADRVAVNEAGYIDAGEDCLTKDKAIFVAGDCRTKRVRQITTASADGSVAAVAACRYLDN
ncbi:MAG: FAD-dependent oxidoreductase [Clostridia bacterium]|nr:FAD-dependent oxidoreductase [Clostridia bacterium]